MNQATVFGGSGFIGSHVCDKLTEEGYDVIIYDCIESSWIKNGQTMFVGDILDESLVRKSIEDSDIVYNFAGIADIEEAQNRPMDTIKYNILGNSIVIEACIEKKIKRYVYASSLYVYSKSGGFYRCSKQACEQYIEQYNKIFNIDYTILRYGSLYGPRAGKNNSINRFIRQALKEKKISYEGSKDAIRDYIHVENAARMSVDILKPEYANEYIILSGQQSMKVGDLHKMVAEIIGTDIELDYQSIEYSAHYETTPYSFNPRFGKKLTSSYYIDLGQGILNIVEELHRQLLPGMVNVDGYLIDDK
jgi:UDP-glucose 4-epimerase